jgi:hypothetical protein
MKYSLAFLCVTMALCARAQKSIEAVYPPMRNFQHNIFVDRISKQKFGVPQFDSINSVGVTIRLISQTIKRGTAVWKVDFPDNPKLLTGKRRPEGN